MGVYKLIGRFSTKKDDTILESNMVQTIGSAGESLAAGAIFTMPALFLWAAEGKAQMPGIVEIALIAMIGGLLGICFMVPLRKALIVKEHGTLPYPEGTACAEVLLAGQDNPVEISLMNRGFSTLFNEHPVYLVLIDESGKVCHVALTDANVNDWQPYETGDSSCTPLLHTISTNLQIPLGLAKGMYRLGLWIPDGSARLQYDLSLIHI